MSFVISFLDLRIIIIIIFCSFLLYFILRFLFIWLKVFCNKYDYTTNYVRTIFRCSKWNFCVIYKKKYFKSKLIIYFKQKKIVYPPDFIRTITLNIFSKS